MTHPRRRPRSAQLSLDQARRPTGHGGWRPGAGRPRGRTTVEHGRRPRFAGRIPQHVTLRLRAGLPSLRRHHSLRVVKRALQAACARRPDDFRVCHFSLLANHLHLIVEAAGAEALASGMQGLAIRLAHRLNALLGRRGSLFAERYHARGLATPREVRHGLRYVLSNARHHAAERGARLTRSWIDPFSSAAWFDGWRDALPAREPWQRALLAEPSPLAAPRVWLLTTGWRRWGPLAFDEVPGAVQRPPPRQESCPPNAPPPHATDRER
jgi:REP-associated tyrosine transposase